MPPTALNLNGVTLGSLNKQVADFEREFEEKRVQLAQKIIDEVMCRVRKRADMGFRDLPLDSICFEQQAYGSLLVFRHRCLYEDGAALEKAQKMLRSLFPQIVLTWTLRAADLVSRTIVVRFENCTWPDEDAQEPNAKRRKLEDRTSLRGKCGICLEEKKLLAALVPCGHTLCCKCITGYKAGGAACPMCKEEVTGTQGVYAET